MADPAARMMTVLVMSTGHVLAAVTCGAIEPSVADLTGGNHLPVRVPGLDPTIRVPASLLSAARIAATDGVLGQPRSYAVVDGKPSLLGPPVEFAPTTPLGLPGATCLTLWQVGDDVVPVDGKLDIAGLPVNSQRPPGAGGRLVFCAGQPLLYEA